MGQKVNPKGLRLGINRTWLSKWYADGKKYVEYLHEDFRVRDYLSARLKESSVSKVEILRSANQITLNIFTSKPGLVIGRQGEGIEKLKAALTKKFNHNFVINIKEVKKPDLDATLIANNIARQIERRIPYRRVSKNSLQKAMEMGAKGVKIQIGGRLNGAEIARSEYFKNGNIPLHTLRANVDYARSRAETTYGTIGIKVWVYKGDIYAKGKRQ